VLTRRDLEALGFSAMAIEHRVATGRLHSVFRGAYAVGRRDLTPHGRWMAAVLACGDGGASGVGAVLSHRSAAELWGIGREWEGRIDVSIRRRSRLERPGIKVRSRPALPSQNLVRRQGIPVTNPVQTLIDLATELKTLRLERAVNEADKLDLVDPETLRRALDAYVGVPGVKTLRTLLDRHTFRLSDSDLEIFFRPLVIAAGFPVPLTKHRVLGYETDFWFPDHGLVIETDGLRYHRTPAQQARAVKRDQIHTAAGLRVLRFTHWQIAYGPNEVTAVLRQIRPHLRESAPAAAT
jgi:very-short-patch-repair endonuclease